MDEEHLAKAFLALDSKLEGHRIAMYAFALALLSKQPDRMEVMRRFRGFLTMMTEDPDPGVEQRVLDAAARAAAGFDRLVQMALTDTDSQHMPDPDGSLDRASE